MLVVEAMKMENALRAPRDGVVKGFAVRVGDTVAAGPCWRSSNRRAGEAFYRAGAVAGRMRERRDTHGADHGLDRAPGPTPTWRVGSGTTCSETGVIQFDAAGSHLAGTFSGRGGCESASIALDYAKTGPASGQVDGDGVVFTLTASQESCLYNGEARRRHDRRGERLSRLHARERGRAPPGILVHEALGHGAADAGHRRGGRSA